MKVIKNLITQNFDIGRAQWNGNPFVVIHTYGGKGTNLFNWFNTNTVGVSSHFSIEKDGTIRQYVELDNTAWANGTSWSNSNGVSVEFQDDGNYNDPNTYTQAQIDSFAWLFVNVINPWASNRISNNEHGITPHNKWTPKECPGKLWDRRNELFAAIKKLQEPAPLPPQEDPEKEKLIKENTELKNSVDLLQDANASLAESQQKLNDQIVSLQAEITALKKQRNIFIKIYERIKDFLGKFSK